MATVLVERPRRPRGEGGEPAALRWLALVAAAFTVAQLVLVPPSLGLGWDETVYVSQVVRWAPAAFFSAPRARGISLLAAPVAALTPSAVALRVHLAVLSGAGLFAALWAWRRLRPATTLVLAGLLFGGLWITLFYGPQAMPNLWVALGGLTAVGCFLRAAGEPDGCAPALGAAGALAFTALMRPSDAAWLSLPLLAALPVVAGGRRRRVLLAAVLGGLLAGCAEWIIEAQVRYGGVLARLHRSSRVEGGIGFHIAVDDHLRALDGRTLCRPCDVPWRHPVTSIWWLVLPVLTAGGVIVAYRARRRPDALLPTACALAVAVPYLFLIGYAAPRFLLPAYALLAVPVADLLTWAVRAAPPRPRPAVIALIAGCLAGHMAVQQVVLARAVAHARDVHGDYARIAAELRRLGVRPPCLLTGDQAIPIAFYARCASAQTSGNNAGTTAAGILGAAAREPVALLVSPGGRRPAYAHGWVPRPLPGLRVYPGYRAYLPPRRARS